MKIVFLDAKTMGEVSFAPIQALGKLICYPTSSPEEARQRVADADVVIVNKVKVDKSLIDAAPLLKLVCVAATGINNIDVEYAASKGISVKNAVGYSTDSVVQTTFMMILSLVGKCRYFDDFVKSGEYSANPIFTNMEQTFFELKGKKMGIIGMGNIGSRVALVAEAFGMEVCYFSTSGTSHCTRYPSLSLEDLLRTCDIVSVHAPLNERTRNLIGAEQLAMMKPSSYIFNAGRGGIIDEAALAQAVDDGVIAGAGVDVFAQEPIPSDHPFLKLSHPERMILTPHIAWASIEARTLLVDIIARNIAETF